MNIQFVEDYLYERRDKYLSQIDNARALNDPDEALMGEAVVDELNHLITVFRLSPLRN